MNQQPPSPQPTDQMRHAVSRRDWLTAAAGATAATALAASRTLADEPAAGGEKRPWKVTRGRIKQSVAQWCFKEVPLDRLAGAVAEMGLRSIELVDPKDWGTLKRNGLICAMTMSHGFVRGMNHTEHHAECVEKLTAAIESTAAAGWPNVITFSGMRGELDDEQGIANTVEGLKKVIGLAEKRKVNVCLEPLNTRVDIEMKGHPGYQCDKVEWAVEVCDRIGSDRMKVLFDIYHVQIMQGDVITRIRQYKDYIAHYHTAGNPGRGDLDDTQEINYPGIMKAIVDTGYRGYVGQEFIPKTTKRVAALRRAALLCDV